MSNFLKEFKDFAMKGNVIDMAVGVIIGAAFGKIVSSLVDDIIMPGIGVLTGGADFKDLKYMIQEAGIDAAGNPVEAVYVAIKFVNKLKHEKPAEEPAPAGPSQEELLTEIRDILAANGKCADTPESASKKQ